MTRFVVALADNVSNDIVISGIYNTREDAERQLRECYDDMCDDECAESEYRADWFYVCIDSDYYYGNVIEVEDNLM